MIYRYLFLLTCLFSFNVLAAESAADLAKRLQKAEKNQEEATKASKTASNAEEEALKLKQAEASQLIDFHKNSFTEAKDSLRKELAKGESKNDHTKYLLVSDYVLRLSEAGENFLNACDKHGKKREENLERDQAEKDLVEEALQAKIAAFVFAVSHFDNYTMRVLAANLEPKCNLPCEGLDEAKSKRADFLAQEEERLTKISTVLGVDKNLYEFWGDVARLYMDLNNFSYVVEQEIEKSQKLFRRNGVWAFRDQCFSEKKDVANWKTLGADAIPYKRAALFLETHKEKGIRAAYELLNLSHPAHKEIGTNARNTNSFTLFRLEDMPVEKLEKFFADHLLLLLEISEAKESIPAEDDTSKKKEKDDKSKN